MCALWNHAGRAPADDDHKLAFWLNVYNAIVQCWLRETPATFENRRAFFGTETFCVAGESLTLDDVEHGILRRSQTKYGLGYIPNPFASGFEKRHRLDARDPRIHFALNCGAKSCPPIRSYDPETVDEALDRATAHSLEMEVRHYPEKGFARIPRVMLWFRGDFGGKAGIYDLLHKFGVVPRTDRPRLQYSDWDWTMARNNFSEQSQ
ncbi:DUF547 domain-containing protein [Haladaptatus sp. GCM10025707]|uniref:DUF547 domain-containing protein n=1 Tax=Haladaptatus sp. GCM10025707 TaxID=3252658 RepID=UPI00360F56C1